MTINDFIAIGEIKRTTARYKRQKQQSKEWISKALTTHEKPYLALSGGKDSVAMAYLVNDVAKEMGKSFTMWAHVSDASFPGTESLITKVASDLGREIIISRSEKAFELLARPERKAFGKTGVFFDAVRTFAKDYDLAFVGTRAYESSRRMRAAQMHGHEFHSASMGNVDVCNPLTWFRLEDVAALVCDYHAPMHPIYLKKQVDECRRTLDGDSWIRLGYTTAKDLRNKGTVVFLKVNYPEIYNRLIKSDPSFANYV
ncbi:MAG: phosphoadenosine phosphosulfate reductase family protein [Fibrobacteraceae bacterium]|nr:phosphoadenosine phosphosulfate reductase family protein [Fibrobacteraceae bacterium]